MLSPNRCEAAGSDGVRAKARDDRAEQGQVSHPAQPQHAPDAQGGSWHCVCAVSVIFLQTCDDRMRVALTVHADCHQSFGVAQILDATIFQVQKREEERETEVK